MLSVLLYLVPGIFAVYSPIRCTSILQRAGLSSRYNETIGHAIHSMTVEGLQLFNPSAGRLNNVPTVNKDLSDRSKLVLDSAPLDPWGSDFTMVTMNVIDNVLSKVGTTDDGLGPHWTPVERLTHVFHMWDLWETIKTKSYEIVEANPPTEDACLCLRDTKSNGIYNAVEWVAEHYLSGTPITLLNRAIPPLTDASSWAVWKERLLHYYKEDALFDAAMYLYCATH